MEYHLYLSLIPETLVVSMLPADEFGRYLAVGTKKRVREEAIFFELKADFESEYFDLQKALQHCTPHENGRPKHSVYVSTYRVLEHIPWEVFKSLWLITHDGRTLELKQGPLPTEIKGNHHLYQELCPVHPLIASLLTPTEFCKFITDPNVTVSVPKICFLELKLGKMLEESSEKQFWDLPYKNIQHLKDCLLELDEKEKITKTVNRILPKRVRYRCIRSGFFVGDQNTVLYYPFPSPEELAKNHLKWWHSAQQC